MVPKQTAARPGCQARDRAVHGGGSRPCGRAPLRRSCRASRPRERHCDASSRASKISSATPKPTRRRPPVPRPSQRRHRQPPDLRQRRRPGPPRRPPADGTLVGQLPWEGTLAPGPHFSWVRGDAFGSARARPASSPARPRPPRWRPARSAPSCAWSSSRSPPTSASTACPWARASGAARSPSAATPSRPTSPATSRRPSAPPLQFHRRRGHGRGPLSHRRPAPRDQPDQRGEPGLRRAPGHGPLRRREERRLRGARLRRLHDVLRSRPRPLGRRGVVVVIHRRGRRGARRRTSLRRSACSPPGRIRHARSRSGVPDKARGRDRRNSAPTPRARSD